MSFERYGFVITVSYQNPLLKGPVAEGHRV